MNKEDKENEKIEKNVEGGKVEENVKDKVDKKEDKDADKNNNGEYYEIIKFTLRYTLKTLKTPRADGSLILTTPLKLLCLVLEQFQEEDKSIQEMGFQRLIQLQKEYPDQPEINTLLARCYAWGFCASKDLEKAISLYESAAKCNYAPALSALSSIVAHEIHPPKIELAIKYLFSAVYGQETLDKELPSFPKIREDAYPIAAYNLSVFLFKGCLYTEDWKIQSNENEALRLMHYAANEKYSYALCALGWIYFDRQVTTDTQKVQVTSISQDLKKAHELIEGAAGLYPKSERAVYALVLLYMKAVSKHIDFYAESQFKFYLRWHRAFKLAYNLPIKSTTIESMLNPKAMQDMHKQLEKNYTHMILQILSIQDLKQREQAIKEMPEESHDLYFILGFLHERGHFGMSIFYTEAEPDQQHYFQRYEAEQNMPLAVHYYQLAASKGSGGAAAKLALIQEYGSDFPQSFLDESADYEIVEINKLDDKKDLGDKKDSDKDSYKPIRNDYWKKERRSGCDLDPEKKVKREAEFVAELKYKTDQLSTEPDFLKAYRYYEFVNQYYNYLYKGRFEESLFFDKSKRFEDLNPADYFPMKLKSMSTVLKAKYALEAAFIESNVELPSSVIGIIAQYYGPNKIQTRRSDSLSMLKFINDMHRDNAKKFSPKVLSST